MCMKIKKEQAQTKRVYIHVNIKLQIKRNIKQIKIRFLRELKGKAIMDRLTHINEIFNPRHKLHK